MMLTAMGRRTRWAGALLFALNAACSTPPAPDKPDEPPTADAGPDQDLSLGAEVTLDGRRSSDPDSDSLAYAWSASLDNPGTVVLTDTPVVRFTPRSAGTYTFVLVVTARQLSSPPDSLRVTIAAATNLAPVANAGPDYALPFGSTFYLDATGSRDADGDSLRVRWAYVSGIGALAIADTSAVQTQVEPGGPGTYVFLLTVSDGALSATDEVAILVTSAGNIPPVADAGSNQTVAVGTSVGLDGGGSSDGDGDRLTFRWSVGNNPGEGVALSDSSSPTPTFTPNLLGDYVFGLVVSDGRAMSLQDTMVVTVVAQIYARRAGMIEIPAGSFAMGSEVGLAGEGPKHTVNLSTFWVDSTEVTAAQYGLCVKDGRCPTPGQQPGCNYGLAERAEHPINCVDYDQAAGFCGWAGKRLPTEAEWEKAARGPNDERRFPWGDDDPVLLQLSFPELRLLNYNNEVGTTAPVGQHPDGVSPYGVHNLAGNVMEWVADWYDPDYYAVSPVTDPPGPATGEQRVARGGNYLAFRENVTVTVRNRVQPGTRDPTLGFRCARSTSP